MVQHPTSTHVGDAPQEELHVGQETGNNEGSMAIGTGPAVTIQPGLEAAEKRRSSPSPLPPYKPVLWGLNMDGARTRRPSNERDSLRNRSREGRPGSRKHRRWTHSVDMVNSLPWWYRNDKAEARLEQHQQILNKHGMTPGNGHRRSQQHPIMSGIAGQSAPVSGSRGS